MTRFRSTLVMPRPQHSVLLFLAALVGSRARPGLMRPHRVAMAKVEKHVDLSGEIPGQLRGRHAVPRYGGDDVLDGAWTTSTRRTRQPPTATSATST